MSVKVRIRNGLEPDGGGVGGASEGDLRGSHTDIIESSGGVVDVAGGQALVHEDTAPSMNVVVDPGVVYIPNTTFDELDSDSVKFWEAVIAGSTASRKLVIGSNSSGQTRIDLICLMIDPGEVPDNEASDIAVLINVAGTPGAGVPATPSFHEPLGSVTVVNGATEIEDDDITDLRQQITLKSAFVPLEVPPAPQLRGLSPSPLSIALDLIYETHGGDPALSITNPDVPVDILAEYNAYYFSGNQNSNINFFIMVEISTDGGSTWSSASEITGQLDGEGVQDRMIAIGRHQVSNVTPTGDIKMRVKVKGDKNAGQSEFNAAVLSLLVVPRG